MYTSVNPNFTIEKWGLRGLKLYRYVFVMESVYWQYLFEVPHLDKTGLAAWVCMLIFAEDTCLRYSLSNCGLSVHLLDQISY